MQTISEKEIRLVGPLTIFVDIDGVCVDFCSSWLMRYNLEYEDVLTVNDIREWEVHKFVKPECGIKVYDYLQDPTLYDFAQPLPGSLEGVKRLRDAGHRVVFATSTAHSVFGRKLEWLIFHGYLEKKHSGYYQDYVEINDKTLLRGDVMVDDGWHNIQKFQGLGILVDCPWNQTYNWPNRVSSVTEAAEKIENLLNKKH